MTNADSEIYSGLDEAVKRKSQEVKVERLSFSVRELKTMYEEGQINIQPDFQRFFRWSPKQKSSLIESMLLSIPLPTVFVAADSEGNWDVVDGVQRLSTVLSYMGVAITESSLTIGETDTEDGVVEPSVEPFALSDLEHLSEGEGAVWDDLPLALRRKIEQTRIDVTIIENTSSPDTKYNLFLRLNSGSILSPQELRNAMLVMVNRDFFVSVKRCSNYDSFKEVTEVSKLKKDQAFRDELVLRFFMQSDFDGDRKALRNDFGDKLTEWSKNRALSVSEDKAKALDEDLFVRTFDLISEVGGADVFRRPSADGLTRRGPVSNAAFEFVTSGVVANLRYWEKNREELQRKLREFWTDDQYEPHVGSGVNARDRFPIMVNNGRDYFAE